VAAGDEALARKAISRKQEHAKVAAALQDQAAAAAAASQTLRRQLEAMLERTRSDLDVNTSAFDKFDRLRQKVERTEAEADALRELAGSAPGQPEPAAESGGATSMLRPNWRN
jgi:phage shock protein A